MLKGTPSPNLQLGIVLAVAVLIGGALLLSGAFGPNLGAGAAGTTTGPVEGYYLRWQDGSQTEVMVIAPGNRRSPVSPEQAAVWEAKGELVLAPAGTKVWKASGSAPFGGQMVEIAEGPKAGFKGWVPVEAFQRGTP
jgi:hypothetical protein